MKRPPLALMVVPCLAAAISAAQAEQGLTVAAVLRDEHGLAGAHDVEVRGGTAYVTGKGGSIAVVDVTQPAAPKMLWSVCDKEAYDDAETLLPLDGDRLLLGTRDLHLFDVTRPAAPRLLAAVKDRARVDTVNGLVRRGDIAYGANKHGHVFAVDLSQRDKLSLLGSRDAGQLDGLALPHDLAWCGDLLVVVSPEGFGTGGRPGKLAVYRVLDPVTQRPLPPDAWTLVGRLTDKRLAGANRVMVRGSIACVGASLKQNIGRADDLLGTVTMVDLSDPTMPRVRSSVAFPDARGPNGLEIAGTVAFAAGGQTVIAVDISDPDTPRELGRLTSPEAFPGGADDGHDLVYESGHLFVTAQSSHALVVIGLSDTIRDAAVRR